MQKDGMRLQVKEVAKFLGMGVSTVWRKVKEDDDFPKPKKHGVRFTYWLKPEIEAYAKKYDMNLSPEVLQGIITSIIGMWFLSFDNGHVRWQGTVVGKEGGWYYCQLFSWLSGEPTDIVIVHSSEMQLQNRFRLYRTEEDMAHAYEAIHKNGLTN